GVVRWVGHGASPVTPPPSSAAVPRSCGPTPATGRGRDRPKAPAAWPGGRSTTPVLAAWPLAERLSARDRDAPRGQTERWSVLSVGPSVGGGRRDAEDDDMGRCDPGLKTDHHLTVTDEHTAERAGSGDVPVLGTPALL